MATINLGAIKFNWKGSYSGATAYVVDDVVESSGSSYICIAATTGNAPPNATYWEQMSQAGTDGTDLTTTLTTQGDIVYRDASGLARLGAGTSGQVLQTNGTGANPSWGTVSSDYVKIANGSHSGTELLIDNFDFSTYKHYKVFLTKAKLSSGSSGWIYCQYRYDNSGSQATDTGNNYLHGSRGYYVYAANATAGENSATAVTDRIRLAWDLSSAVYPRSQDLEMTMSDWNRSGLDKPLQFKIFGGRDVGAGEYGYYLEGFGLNRATGQDYNGLKFGIHNGNGFQCDYSVYGIK
jgi:hypothetical protein